MRPIISGGNSFWSVDRYLLPHEQQLITIRRHPAILLGPSLIVLAGLGAVVALTSLLKISGDVLLVVWLAWSLLLLRLIWKVINWPASSCIVTSDRMIVISGVLARDVTMIPFVRLTDIYYERSILDKLIGCGSFILEVADHDVPMWKIDFIPYPEQLYDEVFSIVRRYLPDEVDSE